MAANRGGADPLELVGLQCVVVVVVMLARQSAEALELAPHASAQRGCEFSDMLVLQR